MANATRHRRIPDSFKVQVKHAVHDWVDSLGSREASTAALAVSGRYYTPVEILDELERETTFGMRFLDGLYTLDSEFGCGRSAKSVVDLIHRYIK